MFLHVYFKPLISGTHTFTIDADSLWTSALKILLTVVGITNQLIGFWKLSSMGIARFWNWQKSLSVYLFKDAYYPIRLFNIESNSTLLFHFTTNVNPNTLVRNMEPYLYQIEDTTQGCPGNIEYVTRCVTGIKTLPYSTEFNTIKKDSNKIPLAKTTSSIDVPCPSSSSILNHVQYPVDSFYNPVGPSYIPKKDVYLPSVFLTSTSYIPGNHSYTKTLSTKYLRNTP